MPVCDLGDPLILDVVGEVEMVAFGASLGKAIRPHTTITLEGDLLSLIHISEPTRPY